MRRQDFVSSRTYFAYTPPNHSRMGMSDRSITVTLGPAEFGVVTTAAAADTMFWYPSASATDRAGNAASEAPVTESGSLDKDF